MKNVESNDTTVLSERRTHQWLKERETKKSILCHRRRKEAYTQEDDRIKNQNMGAYLRKMAIDGYIVNTDTTPLKKQYEEMHKIGVNINQIAKR